MMGLALAPLALLAPLVSSSLAAEPVLETLQDAVLCGLPNSGSVGALPSALGPDHKPPPPSAAVYHPGAVDPAAPWMAKLEVVEARPGKKPAIWTCGGAVVAPDWIVTAAHCVSIKQPLAYRVTVGARNLLDRKALRRDGEAAYCQPGFDKTSLREDLALLKLTEPLPDDFPTLRLANPDEIYGLMPGAIAMSAGWAPVGDGKVSPWLRRAEVRIVSPYREKDGFIEAAPPLNGPSLCLGESGAPLIADLGQGPALHGVFTSVDVVWDQLSRKMTELCEGFEARSYFTPVRGRRLWMARVVSACGRNPLGCVASQ